MTPERPSGIEAFRSLSFREIAVPKEQALNRLSERGRIVARERLWRPTLMTDSHPDMSLGPHRFAVGQMEEMIQQHTPGVDRGMVMTQNDIDLLYSDERREFTFKDNLDVFARDLSRNLSERRAETIVNSHHYVGYILDYLHLVEPTFGSYRNSVSVLAQSFDENDVGGYDLGLMVKRVALGRERHVLATGRIDPVELRTDHNLIDHFIDAYLELASRDDRDDFAVGLHAF